MPTYQSLQKISQDLLSGLLRSRTDFLLHQTAMWQAMNDEAKVSTIYVKPESLDLYHTKFEFFMVQQVQNWFVRLVNRILKKHEPQARFRICGNDEQKGIRVTIAISIQSDKQTIPEIKTEPGLPLKPRETYVTGIAL